MYAIEYNPLMFEIRRTAEFDEWLEHLRDTRAQARILVRLDRMEEGNFGDHKRFDGLLELRIDAGPGYRVYCVERRKTLIVILAGGSKSQQQKDIARAKRLAETL